ncbi:MAG: hypothetical protein V1492_01415 [Candidatus Micrarchaeota archaeon]
MPLTPLHIGPATLIFAIFSFLCPISLLLGATMLDVEGFSYYFLGVGQSPHGLLHTPLAATVYTLLVVVPLVFLMWFVIKKTKMKYAAPAATIIVASALLGVYSHILLDAMLYSDLNLAWPLPYWNPLLGTVDMLGMTFFCILCFLAALAVFAITALMRRH